MSDHPHGKNIQWLNDTANRLAKTEKTIPFSESLKAAAEGYAELRRAEKAVLKLSNRDVRLLLEDKDVTIHLTTGSTLVGTITGITKYEYALKVDGSTHILHKHAIVSIELGEIE